jgi:hypothetical protein
MPGITLIQKITAKSIKDSTAITTAVRLLCLRFCSRLCIMF